MALKKGVIAAIAVLLIVAVVALCSNGRPSYAQTDTVSVWVQPGDTVVALLQEYNCIPAGMDYRVALNDFGRINHVNPDRIQAGQVLVLPVYSSTE